MIVALSDITRYLSGHVEYLRHRPEVVEFADEIADLAKRARREADRRQPRWWAGTCDHATDEALVEHVMGAPLVRCREALRVPVGRDSIVCRACGTEHQVADRRVWLLREMRKEHLTLMTMVTALAWLGRPVPFGRLRTWAWRNKIQQHGEDAEGRTLYSAADVLRLTDEADAADLGRTA